MSSTSQTTDVPNPGLIDVLRNPAFFIFSLSVIFSQVAFNMMNIVLIFQAFKLTGSSLAVSFLILAITIPQAFFSFLGGIIGDAKNKRFILIIGNIVRAIFVMGFFFFSESLAYLYLAAFLISLTTQFYVPAETPIIPHIVKKNYLLAANSLFGVFLFGSILIGYVIGGPLLKFFGHTNNYLFIGALFLSATIFAYLIPNIPASIKIGFTEKGGLKSTRKIIDLVIRELKESIAIVNKNKEIGSAVLFLALSQVITLIMATIIPDFAVSHLAIDAEDMSLVIFAPAALGMISMALFIGAYFKNTSGNSLMNLGIFLSASVLLLLALIPYQGLLLPIVGTVILAFFAGVANALIFVPSQTIIQSTVHDSYRSKIYGLIFTLAGVLVLLPIVLTGLFADIFGAEVILIALSIFIFMVGIRRIKVKERMLKI